MAKELTKAQMEALRKKGKELSNLTMPRKKKPKAIPMPEMKPKEGKSKPVPMPEMKPKEGSKPIPMPKMQDEYEMKKGGKVKMKSGGKVRGAGCAQRGVRPAKMR